MKIGLIAGVLLSAAMPLLTLGNELEQNVIKYMPKSMQPNLPGKFKADEIILKRISVRLVGVIDLQILYKAREMNIPRGVYDGIVVVEHKTLKSHIIPP